MINNRQQNGRRRGRGGGGPRPQGNPGRPDGGGNRIDSRARGNAQQLHEKYKNLARDSQMQGDRVTTEYYLQFADHYFRVLSESRARFDEQRPQRNDSDDDFEGEDGDSFEARDNAPRDNAPRENAQRDNNQRGNRDRGDRNQYRRDDERREHPSEQADAGAEEQRTEARVESANDDSDDRPRRARRPRREEESQQPDAFDADRLPPAIAIADDLEEAPAPRRRGRRPRVEGANDTVEVPPAA